MRARSVTTVAALAGLLSLLAVGTARADDAPALTTPGSPVVVTNEPHHLTLAWAPSAWAGEPAGEEPITYEVRAQLGPHVYRALGTTTATTLTLTNLAPGSEYRLVVGAYTLGGYSDPSPVTPVRTAYGRAKVSYRNVDWSPTDNQIQHVLQVANTGSVPLDLATVRVRYHLTFQGGNTSLVPNCDWAAVGCDQVGRSVTFFPPPLPPSPPAGGTPTPTPTHHPLPGTPVPGWVELTFTGGILAPGASTGPIHLRHHRPDWTGVDERDDPSWRAATGQWIDNSRITLDVDGVREFGDTYA
ncbi:Fibronectin type III domain-containing protein [Micromonospora citrea]|uniref:Fibronectin type III domain-containing protein n=1 Tax=Micromonospora citrea TaxID=47855 RepID=A0A1C6UH93_9ACTN|nr:cellulose binding domain-containing protein [Micromonospora citrea]SCL53465.1 Fibronectin type III domain-containing protein [Micromonospora citrea]